MRVSLDLIKPTQKYLKSESLEKIMALCELSPPCELPLPVVRLVNNDFLVVDGHHRLAAASLRGDESMEVYVLSSRDDLPDNVIIRRRYDAVIQDRSLVLSRGIKTVKEMYGYRR